MIPHLHPHAGDCEHACCLKIEHLSVHIGGETILDNIDLHMHCGQMVALIGPNGAGKSTLIRAILGQREYEGKITFHEASGKEAKLRIGYVPQKLHLDATLPLTVSLSGVHDEPAFETHSPESVTFFLPSASWPMTTLRLPSVYHAGEL